MATENISIARGSKVLVELVDQSGGVERMELTLVESKQADLKSGLLDETAPLARALMSRRVGETVPYEAGDLKEVRILSVRRVEAGVAADAAEKRRETVRKAETQSELINQLNFATSSGSKWGDYDVDVEKLMERREKKEEDNNPSGATN